MTAALKAGIFTELSTDPTLSGLVGTRIYPDEADQKDLLPYIVYEVDSEEGTPHMLGVASLAQTNIQFTVWAATSISRSAINDALRVLLDGKIGVTFGTVEIRAIRNTNAIDTKGNPDDGTQNNNFGTFNDYDFWYLRS